MASAEQWVSFLVLILFIFSITPISSLPMFTHLYSSFPYWWYFLKAIFWILLIYLRILVPKKSYYYHLKSLKWLKYMHSKWFFSWCIWYFFDHFLMRSHGSVALPPRYHGGRARDALDAVHQDPVLCTAAVRLMEEIQKTSGCGAAQWVVRKMASMSCKI